MEGVGNEAVVAWIKLLFGDLPEGTEEYHEELNMIAGLSSGSGDKDYKFKTLSPLQTSD
jgi:hypothetical protein